MSVDRPSQPPVPVRKVEARVEKVEKKQSSERTIERADGSITEKLLNYRQFMCLLIDFEGNEYSESLSEENEKDLPALSAEITFKDRTTGKELRFNDLLPKGWKIVLSGDSMERVFEFPRHDDMPETHVAESLDGIRECADLTDDINTVHYNALESQRRERIEGVIFQDLTVLLHEIGHSHQKESATFKEDARVRQKVHDFIQENTPTRNGRFMEGKDLQQYISVNPAAFGVFGYKDAQGAIVPYSETVSIPRALFESLMQASAWREKDAHRFAMKKIVECRKNGINIEGEYTIEQIHQFMLAALNTYNRGYSTIMGHPVTAFTDDFELSQLFAETGE